jgi:hypothetical protein
MLIASRVNRKFKIINRVNLPNYFLADLPPEAMLTPAIVTEACQTLKRNREQYLARRTTANLVSVLCAVGANWLRPDDAFRRLALERGPAETGFSRETLARGLDAFFRELTPEKLGALITAELGHGHRFDAFCSDPHEQRQMRAALALGPDLLVHVAAGNLPSPALMSMVLGLLTRSAQFVKCATGGSLLPHLFAHSLYEADPKLGACLELAAWRGGAESLEEALFTEAVCVTATGSDETLSAIRRRLPASVRFLGYGHRVSFAFVGAAVLTEFNTPRVVSRVAADVTAWNQLGCLSPHVIYVEQGGNVDGTGFAKMLADELQLRELAEPRGPVPEEVSIGIASRRGIYEVRAAHTPDTRQWCSEGSTAWTVVFEADARFQLSCLNRFVYVKPVANLAEALHGADPVRQQVSTVGLAVPEHTLGEVGAVLARWGATRICPVGRMQEPPLNWRHDGRPALADLVTWADLEM